MNPLLHYVLFGAAEGRSPHPCFDAAAYICENPDLTKSGVNPLLAFLHNGGPKHGSPAHLNSLEAAATNVHSSKHNGAVSVAVATSTSSQEKRLRLAAASQSLTQALEGTTALISVVIPCFNYGKFVWDAICSVTSQTYPNIEIIVIDDGSTDPETLRVLDGIQHERVRIVHQSNQGLAQARNNAATIANGQYLIFLDADDRLERNAIGLLLYALLKNSLAAYAYSSQRFFGDQNLVWVPQEFNAYDLLWSNHPSVTCLIRRRAFDAVGGYRPELLHGYEGFGNFGCGCPRKGIQESEFLCRFSNIDAMGRR